MDLIIEREELLNQLNLLLQNLEKENIEIEILKNLKENLNKEFVEREILFKLGPEILKSSRNNLFYFHVGDKVFIECDLEKLKILIEKRVSFKERKLRELKEDVKKLEKRLVEIESKLQTLAKNQDLSIRVQ